MLLDVEERKWGKDVHNDHQQHQCESQREDVTCYGFNNILQSLNTIDDIQQMEGVENVLRNVTKDWNTEVKNLVLKHAICHKEHDVVYLEFGVGIPVAKIWILILF